jgi:hypothetical protein
MKKGKGEERKENMMKASGLSSISCKLEKCKCAYISCKIQNNTYKLWELENSKRIEEKLKRFAESLKEA